MLLENQVIQNTMKSFESNFRVSENKKPEPVYCRLCSSVIEALLLEYPKVLGGSLKWFMPGDMCRPCKENEEQKIREKNEKIVKETNAAKEKSRLELAFKNARISPEASKKTFDNFIVSATNKKAYDYALNFDLEKRNSLFFYGPPGVGKTHLISAIANKFVLQTNILLMSCPELLGQIRRNLFDKANDSLELAKKVPLLFVDDIGTEKPSDWVQQTLFELIDYRIQYELPTIFTSNCTIGEIAERLGDKISSRITGMCYVIKIDGNDYRLKLRKQA